MQLDWSNWKIWRHKLVPQPTCLKCLCCSRFFTSNHWNCYVINSLVMQFRVVISKYAFYTVEWELGTLLTLFKSVLSLSWRCESLAVSWHVKKAYSWGSYVKTIMHSSRMRTSGSLTICQSMLPGVCTKSWGLLSPGGVPGSERCTWSRGVCAQEGVCSGGDMLPGDGGVCSQGGVSQHALRQTLPCEQNHTHL